MNIEKIISDLKRNKDKIIERLLSKNGDHFVKYLLIKEKFPKDNIDNDDEFKKKFCSFYAVRGMNGLEKKEFFKLFSLEKNNLELKNILEKLCKISNNGERHRLFLSFGTKLLHTIDEKLPIYDGNIAYILELVKQTYPTSIEKRIQNRKDIYEELKDNFIVLLENEQIRDYLKNTRQELQSKAKDVGFEWKDNLISDTKLLDSLLWAFYTILKNEVKI